MRGSVAQPAETRKAAFNFGQDFFCADSTPNDYYANRADHFFDIDTSFSGPTVFLSRPLDESGSRVKSNTFDAKPTLGTHIFYLSIKFYLKTIKNLDFL